MNTAPYSWDFRPRSAGGGRSHGLEPTAHSLYSARSSAVRADDSQLRPLTATAPGDGGSRRFLLHDRQHAARPKLNAAQYSSPFMLKQLADTATPPRRKEHGVQNDALTQLDGASSASVYNRHRSWQSSTLPGSYMGAADDGSLPPSAVGEEEEEETTPEAPPATASGKVEAGPRPGGNARRRLLEEASTFYSNHGPDALADSMAHLRVSPSSVSRQQARAAQQSDPFGHSVAGRGHWSIGPLR